MARNILVDTVAKLLAPNPESIRSVISEATSKSKTKYKTKLCMDRLPEAREKRLFKLISSIPGVLSVKYTGGDGRRRRSQGWYEGYVIHTPGRPSEMSKTIQIPSHILELANKKKKKAPKKVQAQNSLNEQLIELRQLANSEGLYDAADFLTKHIK